MSSGHINNGIGVPTFVKTSLSMKRESDAIPEVNLLLVVLVSFRLIFSQMIPLRPIFVSVLFLIHSKESHAQEFL